MSLSIAACRRWPPPKAMARAWKQYRLMCCRYIRDCCQASILNNCAAAARCAKTIASTTLAWWEYGEQRVGFGLRSTAHVLAASLPTPAEQCGRPEAASFGQYRCLQ